MASTGEAILKAYLVKIGFKVDEQGYKSFKDKIEGSDKKLTAFWSKAKQLGEVAIATITAFGGATLLTASKLEKLYFASRRIGTSVKELQAFSFGAKQIGISAEEAQGALENLARSMRLSPGLQGLLAQMGVNPAQDRTKVMLDLVDRLRRMPFYQGASLAQLFGIDDQTLFMLEQNFDELNKFMGLRKQMAAQAGTDADQMAEKSHKLMQAQRSFDERLEILTDLATTKLMPDLEKLTDKLDKILDFLLKLDQATHGWSTALTGLGAAMLGLLGTATTLRGILGSLGIGGEAAAGAGGFAAGGLLSVLAVIPGLVATGFSLKEAYDFTQLKGEAREKMHLHRLELLKQQRPLLPEEQEMYDRLKRGEHPLAGQPAPAGNPVTGDLHNPGNLRMFGDAPTVERFRRGLSIGRFARFSSDEEGLRALAQQLLLYGGRGLDTVEGIVGRYAPASENDVPAYVKDVTKRLGVGMQAHLNLKDPETLANLMGAMIRHEQGRLGFTHQALLDAARYRLGGPGGTSVTLNQDTKIIIQGGDSSRRTAEQAANLQKRVNGDLIRDLAAVVR